MRQIRLWHWDLSALSFESEKNMEILYPSRQGLFNLFTIYSGLTQYDIKESPRGINYHFEKEVVR